MILLVIGFTSGFATKSLCEKMFAPSSGSAPDVHLSQQARRNIYIFSAAVGGATAFLVSRNITVMSIEEPLCRFIWEFSKIQFQSRFKIPNLEELDTNL